MGLMRHLAGVLVACVAVPACAAPIFMTVSFTGSPVYGTGGGGPFDQTVTGDFQLRFDTNRNYNNDMAAILAGHTNVAVTSPFALTYDPASQLLTIGGSYAGTALMPGTNDAFLRFSTDPANPNGPIFAFSTETFFYGVYFAVPDITYSMTPAPVPEPATWMFMTAGLGFAGLGMRTKRRPSEVRQA